MAAYISGLESFLYFRHGINRHAQREREREILFFFCRNEVREWEKTKGELEKILSLEMRRRKEQDDGKIRTPFPLRRKESEEKCHTP